MVKAAQYLKAAIGIRFAQIAGGDEGAGIAIGQVDDVLPDFGRPARGGIGWNATHPEQLVSIDDDRGNRGGSRW